MIEHLQLLLVTTLDEYCLCGACSHFVEQLVHNHMHIA